MRFRLYSEHIASFISLTGTGADEMMHRPKLLLTWSNVKVFVSKEKSM